MTQPTSKMKAAARSGDRAQVDIVLCTFNGARFLAEQLDSLERQTYESFSISAFDDASTDSSLKLLQRYSETLPLRVHVNETRRGPVANFNSALAASAGEFVFLCDQDDVWKPQKMAVMLARMRSEPDALLLASDAEVIDASGRPTGSLLLDLVGARGAETWSDKLWLANLLRRNRVTGATCVLRRELLALALPIPEGYWHDEWLALVAAALGAAKCIELPLVEYRLHDSNASGLSKVGISAMLRGAATGGRKYYARRAEKLDVLDSRLSVCERIADKELDTIRAARQFWLERAKPRRSFLDKYRRTAASWRAGDYHRFADGLKSVARDLLM